LVIVLQAIKDVLGDAATEEVMTAWTEAYRVLAEIFINREQQNLSRELVIGY
jgi:nitric oxide dioxygenase